MNRKISGCVLKEVKFHVNGSILNIKAFPPDTRTFRNLNPILPRLKVNGLYGTFNIVTGNLRICIEDSSCSLDLRNLTAIIYKEKCACRNICLRGSCRRHYKSQCNRSIPSGHEILVHKTLIPCIPESGSQTCGNTKCPEKFLCSVIFFDILTELICLSGNYRSGKINPDGMSVILSKIFFYFLDYGIN